MPCDKQTPCRSPETNMLIEGFASSLTNQRRHVEGTRPVSPGQIYSEHHSCLSHQLCCPVCPVSPRPGPCLRLPCSSCVSVSGCFLFLRLNAFNQSSALSLSLVIDQPFQDYGQGDLCQNFKGKLPSTRIIEVTDTTFDP